MNKEVKTIQKNKLTKNRNNIDTNLDIQIKNNNENNIKLKKNIMFKKH